MQALRPCLGYTKADWLRPLPGHAEADSRRVGSYPGCPGGIPEPVPALTDSHLCKLLERQLSEQEETHAAGQTTHLLSPVPAGPDGASLKGLPSTGLGTPKDNALKGPDAAPWPPDFGLQPKGSFLTNHNPPPKLQTKCK